MNRHIVTVILISALAACTSLNRERDFSDYRYHVFQWVFPEYYYRAEEVPIPGKISCEEVEKIHFFGLTAEMPERYSDSIEKRESKRVGWKAKEGMGGMFFSLEDENIMLCSEFAYEREKDFCSSFGSAGEYYHKIYTLTPDEIDENTTTGDMLLIHAKGVLFEGVRKIVIYKGGQFTGYARYFDGGRADLSGDLVLFHKALPEKRFIMFGFKLSETAVEELLASLATGDPKKL